MPLDKLEVIRLMASLGIVKKVFPSALGLHIIGIYKLFAKGTDVSFLSIYSHVTQCNAPPPS